MFEYLDKNGNPLTDEQYCALVMSKEDYKRVAEDTLADGKWISTVWLGIDHSFGDAGVPLIFETMVFPSKGNFRDLSMQRYATLDEAVAGHKATVKEWSKKDKS